VARVFGGGNRDIKRGGVEGKWGSSLEWVGGARSRPTTQRGVHHMGADRSNEGKTVGSKILFRQQGLVWGRGPGGRYGRRYTRGKGHKKNKASSRVKSKKDEVLKWRISGRGKLEVDQG